MASSPAPTVPCVVIDATGCHVPSYPDYLSYFVTGMQGIYGQDIVLTPDTQDGQLLAIVARAAQEAGNSVEAAYNAFAPSTAQGVGLSRSVKINGLARKVASYSTADLRIVGQVGTEILSGLVSGEDGSVWAMPPSVKIPEAGEVTVTATCTTLGSVTARPGSITSIQNPTRGWQSAENWEAATPGLPIERDAQLRLRQSRSTTLPSSTILDGIIGGILSLPNVARVKGYENDTSKVNDLGLPPRSVALVVDGGDAQAIADVVGTKKAPGITTYGGENPLNAVAQVYTDDTGIRRTIHFLRPHRVPVAYRVEIAKKAGWSSDVADKIRVALAAYSLALDIGDDVVTARTYVPAQLVGDPSAVTFDLLSVSLARDGATPSPASLPLAFDEAAYTEATPDYVDIIAT